MHVPLLTSAAWNLQSTEIVRENASHMDRPSSHFLLASWKGGRLETRRYRCIIFILNLGVELRLGQRAPSNSSSNRTVFQIGVARRTTIVVPITNSEHSVCEVHFLDFEFASKNPLRGCIWTS